MSKQSNKARPGDYIRINKHGGYGKVIISYGTPITHRVVADMYPGADSNYEYMYFEGKPDVEALNEYKTDEFTIVPKSKLPKWITKEKYGKV